MIYFLEVVDDAQSLSGVPQRVVVYDEASSSLQISQTDPKRALGVNSVCRF